MTEDMRERFEKWANDPKFCRLMRVLWGVELESALWEAWQAALSSAGTSGTADARLSAMLYRSLERLSLAIAACAHIGFEESSPTTNEHHASIWLDLNEAQKDAKLKLKHYAQFVRGDSLSGKGEATKEEKFVSTDEKQIKHMVERFLQWKLPENFNPDGGISFKKMFNEHTDHPMKHEPVGTNLFDYTQADQMVRYIVDGLPSASAPDRAEELAREIAEMCHAQCFAWSRMEHHDMTGSMQRDRLAIKVASLLRREMGRWIPVSERLPDTNEAGVSSVFFWVTSEDGWQFGYYRKDAEGEYWESERSDAYNEPYTYSTEQVSYWLPESALPAPPREEG